jgi:hypothetical protein
MWLIWKKIVSNCQTENENDFLILLQSSLQSENMAAIVYFDNEWYGAIQCKLKFCLIYFFLYKKKRDEQKKMNRI